MNLDRRYSRKLLAVALSALAIGACVTPASLPPAHISSLPSGVLLTISSSSSVRIVSLNAAHSRSMGFHQALQSAATAEVNLDSVAALLDRQNADLVALQEVDGPSVWSGGFDHVDYLARAGGYTSTVRGTHMKMPGLDYGTALLARYPMDNALSVGFGHALSVTRKGFVVSEMQWPGALDTTVDIVSLHLHPFRANARIKQIRELIATLKDRGRPVIVMGDFNDDWRDDDTAARMLSSALGLSAQQPACDDCHTHRRMKSFVDWILISPELQFQSFEILDDDVSDHYAIAATVQLRESPNTADRRL